MVLLFHLAILLWSHKACCLRKEDLYPSRLRLASPVYSQDVTSGKRELNADYIIGDYTTEYFEVYIIYVIVYMHNTISTAK